MNKRQFLILFFFISYLATDVSFAAPIIYRQERMKAMRQQEEQEEYDQQQQQQQGQQQGAQGQGQQASAQQTYQQQIDQRNQAIAQAIRDAHNQAMPSQGTGNVQVQQQTADLNVVQPIAVQAGPSDVKDVVDLSEVWKKLDTKSTVWSALIDDQAKLLTVSEYIDRFQKEGVKIQAPPLHYVQEIDQIVAQNPEMLQRPFGELLQISAIVDYDFDNGMDKDMLAKKVLGEAGFESNKKRLVQAQQAQQQQPMGQ